MDELEDKHKLIWEKIFPTCVMVLTFFLRFLQFYEVKGITVRNGWAAPINSKAIFLIAVLIFFAGTWMKFRHNIIRIFLQVGSVILMLYCEWLFIDFSDYKLSWTSYGLWIYVTVSVLLMFYCLYIFKNTKI